MVGGDEQRGIDNRSCWAGARASRPFTGGGGRPLSILWFAGSLCVILRTSDCLLLRDPCCKLS